MQHAANMSHTDSCVASTYSPESTLQPGSKAATPSACCRYQFPPPPAQLSLVCNIMRHVFAMRQEKAKAVEAAPRQQSGSIFRFAGPDIQEKPAQTLNIHCDICRVLHACR